MFTVDDALFVVICVYAVLDMVVNILAMCDIFKMSHCNKIVGKIFLITPLIALSAWNYYFRHTCYPYLFWTIFVFLVVDILLGGIIFVISTAARD